MTWKSDVSSNQTFVSVSGMARMMGVTPERVYQLIGDKEIPAPTTKVNERQRVYSLDEALAIWKEHAARGALVEMPRVSSNHSR